MALKINHPSVTGTWHEISVTRKSRKEYEQASPHAPAGTVVLVVETTLHMDGDHPDHDSSEIDTLIDLVDEAIAGSALYAGARIVKAKP